MSTDISIEINCPKIKLLDTDDCDEINKYMEGLVKSDYKIIDFGFIEKGLAYVKYTGEYQG